MAMGGLPEHNDDSDDFAVFSEINITPLTDVFLVLLIIFMVTSSAISQSGVKVNLPKGGAASSTTQSKGVTVTLDAESRIYVNDSEETLITLEQSLKKALLETTNRSVVLAGDQEVMLGLAIQVMNIARKAGAEKFGIATKGQAINRKAETE